MPPFFIVLILIFTAYYFLVYKLTCVAEYVKMGKGSWCMLLICDDFNMDYQILFIGVIIKPGYFSNFYTENQ